MNPNVYADGGASVESHIGTHRGTKTVPHKQRQFGIWHLLVATSVAAFAISVARYIRNVLPEYHDLVFWFAMIVTGTYSRWLGWKLNWPPGTIGRHAIAFFSASIGCASMIVLLNYQGSWPDVIRDIPKGLGAAAMMNGVFAGAIIASAFWLLSLIRSPRKNNEMHARHS